MNNIDEYAAFQYYLRDCHKHGELKPGVNISNPFLFEEQDTPSFGIAKGHKGDWIFKDFATGDQGPIEVLVMKKFGMTRAEAEQKLQEDFGHFQQYSSSVSVEEKDYSFEIEYADWNEADIGFWTQKVIDGASDILFKVSKYKRAGANANWIVSKDNDPIYAYKIGSECIKLYRPYNKQYKFSWLGKKPSDYIFLLDKTRKGQDVVILCAGEKDTLTARFVYGYDAICLNSETALPSSDLISKLLVSHKYRLVCYDNDETGVKQSKKVNSECNFNIMTLPDMGEGKKDIYDFSRINGDFEALVNDTISDLSIFNNAYRMTLDIQVPPQAVTVTFRDNIFVKRGNISTVVAGAGIGKSQLMDAISSQIFENTDGLGFSINHELVQRVLHVDTERDPFDFQLGLRSIYRRAGIKDDYQDKLHYWSTKMIPNAAGNREWLENMLTANIGMYQLIILDGIGDFVKSYNDEEECMGLVKWLDMFAQKHQVSIIVTIHENIGSEGRAKGHLGAFCYQKSVSMLRLQVNSEHADVKELTNEFPLGKFRSGTIDASPYVYQRFRWNTQASMFTSLAEEDEQFLFEKVKKDSKYYFNKVFYNTSVNKNEKQILNELVRDYDLSMDKGKKLLKEWKELNWLIQFNNVYQIDQTQGLTSEESMFDKDSKDNSNVPF